MEQEIQAFWKVKKLADMSRQEWESLCDGCARCCLLKLEDDDDGASSGVREVHLTRLACRLLDVSSCNCTNYENRQKLVPDCVSISPEVVLTLPWLPDTCAYRLVAEGRDLEWWHPLVSGTRDTVHSAGISVRGAVISEGEVDEEDVERYIVQDYPVGR